MRYLKVWLHLTGITTQIAFQSRFGAVVFLIGKILRFLFFLLFLYIILSKTKAIVGFSFWQIVFFYATFNLIDTLPQFFMREVYRFRSYVVSGHFDFILTKPISPLFRSLFGGSDILDLSILILSLLFIIFAAINLGGLTVVGMLTYILLVGNAFAIALAFHIFVLSVGIMTTEIDNSIMLYRDLTQMGRVPVDVYHEPLRALITFVVPVGIMMTFPAKALMGILSVKFLIISVLIGTTVFILSLWFWKFALKNYSSASS